MRLSLIYAHAYLLCTGSVIYKCVFSLYVILCCCRVCAVDSVCLCLCLNDADGMIVLMRGC